MEELTISDIPKEKTWGENKKIKLENGWEEKQIDIMNFDTIDEKLLNSSIINYASDYIDKFVENSKGKWQVARGFVTSIIEVNYNLFSNIESTITAKASDISNQIKIRFLQPAQSFYHHLMKIWFIFKTNNFYSEVLKLIIIFY